MKTLAKCILGLLIVMVLFSIVNNVVLAEKSAARKRYYKCNRWFCKAYDKRGRVLKTRWGTTRGVWKGTNIWASKASYYWLRTGMVSSTVSSARYYRASNFK